MDKKPSFVNHIFKHITMSYYFSKTLRNTTFEEAIDHVTAALKTEGFGVLTEIDIKATLKKKLDVDINKYRILGACNPPLAYQAIQAESKIGLMLPCNVTVQEHDSGDVEVSAVDPIASMQAIENDSLGGVATEVATKLRMVIEGL
jgi:uncharacterized protein (DUF302 family)